MMICHCLITTMTLHLCRTDEMDKHLSIRIDNNAAPAKASNCPRRKSVPMVEFARNVMDGWLQRKSRGGGT